MNTNKTINQTASKTAKAGMFVTEDSQNVLFTFLLLILLFALWGFCNGMIDVMDKHFQKVLLLSLSQPAWVQFAHYLGYFLMALPAGWLAAKIGLQRRHHGRGDSPKGDGSNCRHVRFVSAFYRSHGLLCLHCGLCVMWPRLGGSEGMHGVTASGGH